MFEVELGQGGRVGSIRALRGFSRVQCVDTSLWDRSARFQIDTLSEGPL